MKVIKHGNMYIEKEIECKHCGALLSYYNKDVIVKKSYNEAFSEYHTFYQEYIICPECEKRIYFIYKIDEIDVTDVVD